MGVKEFYNRFLKPQGMFETIFVTILILGLFVVAAFGVYLYSIQK